MGLDLTTPQAIPADFNDRLSLQLLLQPDAEYVFARHAFGALAAEAMSGMDGFDLAIMQAREGRLVQGAGIPANLAEAMAAGMGGPLLQSAGVTFPDMVRMVAEAAQPGEVIKINRPQYLNGATTVSSRQASPTTKLFGTNSQAIGMDQVSLTIVEYLGPGAAGTGTPTPISLPRFTQHRAAHDLLVDVGYQLRRDRYRFVDDKIMNDMINAVNGSSNSPSGVTRPVGMTSASTYTGTGNEPFTYDLIVSMCEAMSGRFIPGVGGGSKYPLMIDIHQAAQLKLDPMYQRLSVFEPQYNPLFPGYMTTVDNAIICQVNRMPRLTNLGASTNITGYQGIMWAPGAYGWGNADNVRALRNRNDDGGRSNEFGWSAYEGFTVLDDRFLQLVITD